MVQPKTATRRFATRRTSYAFLATGWGLPRSSSPSGPPLGHARLNSRSGTRRRRRRTHSGARTRPLSTTPSKRRRPPPACLPIGWAPQPAS